MKKSKNDVIDSLLAGAGDRELRARVDAHCVSCVYDELLLGTWRQQVEGCTVTDCPLYDVRPKSRSIAAKSRPEILDGVLVPVEEIATEMQRFDDILRCEIEDSGPDE